MRRTIGRLAAAAACLALAAGHSGAAGASPLGTWVTDGGKSHIKIEPCGDKLCGAIVWLEEPNNKKGSAKLDVNNKDESLRSRPILGLPLLTDFAAKSASRWEGGKIYNPEDGKTYRSKLELVDPDTLKVSGCFLFFCKDQTWTRVP